MRSLRFALLPLVLLVGCNLQEKLKVLTQSNTGGSADGGTSLAEARKGFQTQLARKQKANEAAPEPPAKVFRKVQFESTVGKLAAYLTPDPKDGKKRPAIIWITGGDCNTIGDVWSAAKPTNDQTARQYRDAGIVM